MNLIIRKRMSASVVILSFHGFGSKPKPALQVLSLHLHRCLFIFVFVINIHRFLKMIRSP